MPDTTAAGPFTLTVTMNASTPAASGSEGGATFDLQINMLEGVVEGFGTT